MVEEAVSEFKLQELWPVPGHGIHELGECCTALS